MGKVRLVIFSGVMTTDACTDDQNDISFLNDHRCLSNNTAAAFEILPFKDKSDIIRSGTTVPHGLDKTVM